MHFADHRLTCISWRLKQCPSYCSAQGKCSALSSCTAGRFSKGLQKLLSTGWQAKQRDVYTPFKAETTFLCPFCAPWRCLQVTQELCQQRTDCFLRSPYGSSGLPAGPQGVLKLLGTGCTPASTRSACRCLRLCRSCSAQADRRRSVTYTTACCAHPSSTAQLMCMVPSRSATVTNSRRLQVCLTVAGALLRLCPAVSTL